MPPGRKGNSMACQDLSPPAREPGPGGVRYLGPSAAGGRRLTRRRRLVAVAAVAVSIPVPLAAATASPAASRVGGEGDDVDPRYYGVYRVDSGRGTERQSGGGQARRIGLDGDRRNAASTVADEPAHRPVMDRVALLVHQADYQGPGTSLPTWADWESPETRRRSAGGPGWLGSVKSPPPHARRASVPGTIKSRAKWELYLMAAPVVGWLPDDKEGSRGWIGCASRRGGERKILHGGKGGKR